MSATTPHDEMDFHPGHCEEQSDMTMCGNENDESEEESDESEEESDESEEESDESEEESDESDPSVLDEDEHILKVYLHFHLKPVTRYYSLEFRPNEPAEQNNNRPVSVWGDVYGLPLWSIPTFIDHNIPGRLERFDSTGFSEVIIRILMQTIEALNQDTGMQWAVLGMKNGNYSMVFTLETPVAASSALRVPDGVVRQVLLLTQGPERCDAKFGIVEEGLPPDQVVEPAGQRRSQSPGPEKPVAPTSEEAKADGPK